MRVDGTHRCPRCVVDWTDASSDGSRIAAGTQRKHEHRSGMMMMMMMAVIMIG